MRVQVILTNWKRPDNVAFLVGMMRAQSEPCRIYIVDNHPPEEPQFALPPETRGQVDDIFRWHVNAGPPCRFVPAFVGNECEYTLFHDDDITTGSRIIEHFLRWSEQLGEFATLGQRGRNVRTRGGSVYLGRLIARCPQLVPADMLCNLHFVRTEHVGHVHEFKWRMLRRFGPDHAGFWHDDLLLSFAVQAATELPSYVTPAMEPEASLRIRGLPAPYALCADPRHDKVRNQLVKMAIDVGWKSCRTQAVNHELL